MKIEVLTTFLDGRDRYETGDVRTVPDEAGARFVAAGWAKDAAGQVSTGTPASGSASLDIHDSTLGVTSQTKE